MTGRLQRSKLKLTEIIKRVKLPAKASIYYLAASAAGKVVSFVITPFTTRLLGKENFGQFSLYMSLLGGVSVICSAFTSSSAVYKGLQNYKSRKNGYLIGVLWVCLAFSTAICTLLFTFMPFFKLKSFLLLPLTLQILCDTTVAVAMSGERFDYKYKTVATVALIIAILPPAMAIIILKIWGGGYIVRIYSMLFVSLCAAVYSLIKLFRGSEYKGKDVKYTIRSSLPLLPHSISSAISVQADKLIISALMGAAALAKYSVAYSLGIALQFTVSAIGSALTPWVIRRLDAGEADRISKLMLPMAVGYCALSLCLVAIAPEAMLILAPRDYLDALPALLPIALSTPLSFISSVTMVGLNYSGKGRYTVIISLLGTALCLFLNYTLIGKYGFIGAGITTLTVHTFTAVIGTLMLGRVKLGNMISLNKLYRPFLMSAVVGVLIFILSDKIVPRILMLLFPAVMLLYSIKSAAEMVIEKNGKVLS